jgi:hypothetical protein
MLYFQEVGNGELMTLDELRRVLKDYPDVMTNPDIPIHFGRMSADAPSDEHQRTRSLTVQSPTNPKTTKGVFCGVSIPKLKTKAPAPQPRHQSTDKSKVDLASKPHTTGSTSSAIQDIMKKYPKNLGSHITPLPKRQMARIVSTTTTIGGALGIPSLAKASLEEMKRMLAICKPLF